jgi:mono/diheme cytochrome c family protein
MKLNLKYVCALLVAVALSALQSGCGENGETNPPAVKLTASTVASTTVSSHAHSVTIPFGDVAPSPGIVTQYRSNSINGHSHVIAVSSQQMTDLNNGMRLSLVSSDPNNGVAAHTHTWNIQGGSVLYEKHCYNCHSYGQQYRSPASNSKMGTAFSFVSSQISAMINPAGELLSGSPAVTPNPDYVPSTSVNAASVYAGLCAVCHSLGTVDTVTGPGPNLSNKGGLVSGKFPIAGTAGHNGLTLTAAEITALAAYFNAN